MTIYISILLVILFSYLLIISFFAYGWIVTPVFDPETHNINTETFISIIIAVRNEEENLPELLSSLTLQSYNTTKYEVIFVNDHSDDLSVAIIDQQIQNLDNYKLLHLKENSTGKKNALSVGFATAKGELIAITDADCRIQPEWLYTLNSYYLYEGKPDMINGLVDMTPASGMLQRFFRLDFISLLVSSVGASYYKRPIFNNAANLAVKKSAINNVDLNNKLSSGDDVFILHNFKKEKKKIKLLKNTNHLVKTAPPQSLSEFLRQRIRWASKASEYTDKDAIFVSWLVFITNLVLLSAYIALLIHSAFNYLFLGMGIKLIADLSVFLSCKHFFKLRLFDLLLVPVIEVFYPIYIVYTAIWSKKKPFQWKGRLLN